MRILLVEDEIEFAQTLRAALERERFVVDHADRLSMAQEAARSNAYDLVLLDRTLPRRRRPLTGDRDRPETAQRSAWRPVGDPGCQEHCKGGAVGRSEPGRTGRRGRRICVAQGRRRRPSSFPAQTRALNLRVLIASVSVRIAAAARPR